MPHRSHLKQQNKRFKKLKRSKNKVRNRRIEKKEKKKEIKRVKDILNERHHLYQEKIKGLKLERQEKAKYVPFYENLNICIVSFHESVDTLSFKKDFIKYLYLENEDDIEIEGIQLYTVYTIHFNEKKKNRSLTIYDVPRTVYGIIDGTKCADIVLCLFKDASLENSCFDETGYELLSILRSQGVPSVIGVSYKNESKNIKSSQRFVLRYFMSEFTEKDKLLFINDKIDFFKLYNEIWNTKIRNLCYRDGRGYMLVDSCEYNSEQNLFYFKGFVKGVGLNTLSPVHITNIGDYYVEDIWALDIQVDRKDTTLEKKKRKKKEYVEFSVDGKMYGGTEGCTNGFPNTNGFLNKSDNSYLYYKDSLVQFLNHNKSTSASFHISYDPMLVHRRNKELRFEKNDDDDFNCIRSVNPLNLNEQNGFTNLMTLQNKNEKDGWNFSKKRDTYRFRESDSENESDVYSVENSYDANMNSNEVHETETVQHNNGVFKYQPNLFINKSRDDRHFVYNPQIEKNNDAFDLAEQKTKNRWTFISEEKHEYNDDVIGSFGNIVENRNENKVENIPNITYEGNFTELNTLKRNNYKETKNEHNTFYKNSAINNNEMKKGSEYEFSDNSEDDGDSPRQVSEVDTDENEDKDKSEREEEEEEEEEEEDTSCKNGNETKLNDSVGDECFELDSVRSEQIYLHPDVSAKERFKKYRSLVSFLNTPIDVYEDLPLAYSRIYDYESYHNLTKYSQKKYLYDCKFINDRFSLTDTYCVLVIANDSESRLLNMIQKGPLEIPLMISSLLPFERKVTVVNMKVKKNSSYEGTVFSKDQLEIVCGFRHFLSRPIFSEQYVKAVQSRGLYERRLKPGDNKVASIYGFTTVTRSSVFLLKETATTDGIVAVTTVTNDIALNKNIHNIPMNPLNKGNNRSEQNAFFPNDGFKEIKTDHISSYEFNVNSSLSPSLPPQPVSATMQQCLKPVVVAVGKIMNCDCRRVIMKRISISGRPYKIHKKKVVVRGMFHNPKDINYFKPVELQTRFGLSGKITESLGTHGKMKCLFSNVVKPHDVIFINLYKRVYPKWFPLSWNDTQYYGPDENVPEKRTNVPICQLENPPDYQPFFQTDCNQFTLSNS